jgi:hypothetical protein
LHPDASGGAIAARLGDVGSLRFVLVHLDSLVVARRTGASA